MAPLLTAYRCNVDLSQPVSPLSSALSSPRSDIIYDSSIPSIGTSNLSSSSEEAASSRIKTTGAPRVILSQGPPKQMFQSPPKQRSAMTALAKSTSRSASKPTLHDLHKSMATVKVGFGEEVFVIHKELLCYHSTYFRGALEGSFAEAQQGVVYLREATVKTFTLFETWLYRQRVPTLEGSEVGCAQLWDELIDLYIFADAHGVAQLGNELVEALIDLAMENHQMPALRTIAAAWYGLPSTSPMRKLLVNLYAWEVNGRTLAEEELQQMPREFLSSVLVICMNRLPSRLKGEEAPFEKNRCQFHIHNSQDEEKACREKRKTPAAKAGQTKTKKPKQTVVPL